MRKPKLELDLKPIIDKKVIDARTEKQKAILAYAIENKGFQKGFDTKKLAASMEYIDDPTLEGPVLTFRYDGEFLFRERTIDKEALHFKYLLDPTDI